MTVKAFHPVKGKREFTKKDWDEMSGGKYGWKLEAEKPEALQNKEAAQGNKDSGTQQLTTKPEIQKPSFSGNSHAQNRK